MDNNKYLKIKSDITTIRKHIINNDWETTNLQLSAILTNKYANKYISNMNSTEFVNSVQRICQNLNNNQTETINIIKQLYSHYNQRKNNKINLQSNVQFGSGFFDTLKNVAQKQLTQTANQTLQQTQAAVKQAATNALQQTQAAAQQAANNAIQQGIQQATNNSTGFFGSLFSSPQQNQMQSQPMQNQMQQPMQNQMQNQMQPNQMQNQMQPNQMQNQMQPNQMQGQPMQNQMQGQPMQYQNQIPNQIPTPEMIAQCKILGTQGFLNN
jgi:hypothetical protein